MKMKNTKKAFTIIELMLAVAFIGTLLLSVAMLAMQLVNMYTKGVAMRSINALGGDIADDIKQTVNSSTLWSENIDAENGSSGYNKDSVVEAKQKYYLYDEKNNYGIFCTNSYTYIFNYQAAMLKYRNLVDKNGADNEGFLQIQISGSSNPARPYGLARIKDSSATLCRSAKSARSDATKENDFFVTSTATRTYGNVVSDHVVKVNSDKDLVVLLDGNDSNDGSDLELYDFTVMHATNSSLTRQALFDVSFVLGTMRGGINVMSSSNYCNQQAQSSSSATAEEKAAAEDMANVGMSYCAVNRFEVTVRQTGNAGV